jgi:hypothetical protein
VTVDDDNHLGSTHWVNGPRRAKERTFKRLNRTAVKVTPTMEAVVSAFRQLTLAERAQMKRLWHAGPMLSNC